MRFKPDLAALSLVIVCLFASDLFAKDRADCERAYVPKFGQSGKDVRWEPTSGEFATVMLRLANATAMDRVYDLGAGDGAIVITAAKQFGATAVGIEYNPDLATLAQCYIEAEGLANQAKVIAGDIFKTDFSEASVVTLFLYPDINLRLRPTLLKMLPGTRVVSNSHTMQDWKWDGEAELNGRHAYLWIVPAQVQGTWTLEQIDGGDRLAVTLKQRFQDLTGKIGSAGKQRDITGAVRGTQVTLNLDGQRKLVGTIEGKRLTASLFDGPQEKKYVGTASN